MANENDTAPRFVWRSTDDSVRNGTISLLAIAEIPVALFLYFYIIPQWFGYWTPVIISAIAAPLLLLRSEESVRHSVAMWLRYVERPEDDELTRREWISIPSVTIILSGAVAWWLTETWLISHAGWALFWRASVVGILCLNLGFAIAVTGAGAGAVVGAVVGAIVGVGVGMGMGMGVGVGAIAIAIAGAGAGAGAVTVAGAVAGAGAVTVTVAVAVAGVFMGLWLRSVFERAAGILHALPKGFAQIGGNWRRAMLCEDFRHAPEVIPGARAINLDLRSTKEIEEEMSWAEIVMLLAYPFAILWRLGLKSTFWLYGPALFIAHPGNLTNPTAREKWLTRGKTAWERLIFWTGLGVFAFTVLTLLDFGDLIALWRESKAAGVPFDLLTWSLALDLEAFLSQPWRWFSLANLLCALGVFFWRDIIAQRLGNGEAIAMHGWPVGALVRLARAQLVFFAGYWFLSLLYFVPFMVESGRAPDWLIANWPF